MIKYNGIRKRDIIKMENMKDSRSNKKNERTSYRFNHNLLAISLIIMALIGTTYFWLDERIEFFELPWILVLTLWQIWLITSLIFIFSRKKTGYLLGGILSWVTVGFLLLDNFHTVFHISVIATEPSFNITIKNFVGIIIAGLSVFSAHNSFHKIRIS